MDKQQVVSAIKMTLASPGYALMEKAIQEAMVRDIDLLTAPKRPDGVSEDFLRGRIDFAKMVIGRFRKEIASYETEQRLAAETVDNSAVGSPYAKDDAGTTPA